MSKRFLTVVTGDPVPDDTEQQFVIAQRLMSSIREALPKSSFDTVAGVEEWDSYGSYFDVRIGKANITTMLQGSDQWLILNWANRTIGDRILGRKHDAELSVARGAVLAAVKSVMPSQNLRWMSEEEFTKQS